MINDLNESNPTEWQTRKNVIYETLKQKQRKQRKQNKNVIILPSPNFRGLRKYF